MRYTVGKHPTRRGYTVFDSMPRFSAGEDVEGVGWMQYTTPKRLPSHIGWNKLKSAAVERCKVYNDAYEWDQIAEHLPASEVMELKDAPTGVKLQLVDLEFHCKYPDRPYKTRNCYLARTDDEPVYEHDDGEPSSFLWVKTVNESGEVSGVMATMMVRVVPTAVLNS